MDSSLQTAATIDVVDVTDRVERAIPTDLDAGLCTVFVPHTTAGVAVNEAEPRLLADLEALLEAVVPGSDRYRHDEIDDNAAAHLRSVLLGESVAVPVRDGSLALGTWQSILFVEGDGPRTRRFEVLVTPIAEDGVASDGATG